MNFCFFLTSLIPPAIRKNVPNLMLDEEVVTAVAAAQFHIWPIHTLDEGIELLTGVPAGRPDENGEYPADSVHSAVQERLLQLAEDLSNFGDDDE